MRVEELYVEGKICPLGIDAARPAFGWSYASSEERGQRQTAYRILVAQSEDSLRQGVADVWDSGRTAGSRCVHVLYGGPPLRSRTRYYWKVRVWDRDGRMTESAVSWWEMALLEAEDWTARWIGMPLGDSAEPDREALPLFRHEFAVSKPVSRARAYICGLGHHELRLNGRKVSDRELEPGWTNYDKTCLYCVYDITDMLREGTNAAGVMLGNGFYHVVGGRYSKFKGSFGRPKCLVQLEIVYSDGETLTVASGESWRAAPGPITFSCIYGGEDYDARLLQNGWDQPGFAEDSRWVQAAEQPAPAGRLKAQATLPLKAMTTFRPVRITQPAPGVYVADFGQNFSGWVEIEATGPKGARISLAPAELLKEGGTVNQKWTGSPYRFHYTLGGQGQETWSPRFSYYGFRYVQIEGAVPVGVDLGATIGLGDGDDSGVSDRGGGLKAEDSSGANGIGGGVGSYMNGSQRKDNSGASNHAGGFSTAGSSVATGMDGSSSSCVPANGDRADLTRSHHGAGSGVPVLLRLEGKMIYPDTAPVGRFECSDELLNRTHEIINWAILSNMKSLYTDCPHREKLGWLEQVHLMGPALAYNYDTEALWVQTMENIRDAQLPSGLVPTTAPEYVVFAEPWDCFRDSVSWGAAYVLIAWNLHRFYGNTRILSEHYDGMKAYVDYVGGRAKRHIVSHGLGDWYDAGPNGPGFAQNTPVAHTETAMYGHMVDVFSRIAGLLGRREDAARYAELYESIRTAFNETFFDPDSQSYAAGSHTSNAMPLALGLAEKRHKEALLARLAGDIRTQGYHTTAGDVGYRYVLLALAQNGRSDIVREMARQTDHPSYGYQIVHGATTLTEAWDGPTVGKSQNHFMLGHLEEWLYLSLAGIDYRFDPSAGSYRIAIKPAVVGGIQQAKAELRLPVGLLHSGWMLETGGRLTMDVGIPVNCTAEVHVPAASAGLVLESGSSTVELVSESGSGAVELDPENGGGTAELVPESGSGAVELDPENGGASAVPGAEFVRFEDGCAVYRLASGTYRFESFLPESKGVATVERQ